MSSPSGPDEHLPGTSRAPRADALRNRARVLSAAHTAFATHGLAAQVEDIARQAGVGVGTVYRNFPTKEALIAAVMMARLDLLSAEARDAHRDPDPWAALERMVWRMATVAAEDRAFTEAVRAHPELVSTVQPEILAAIQAAMEGFVALLVPLVARAQAAGVLRADVTADDLPQLVTGIAGASGPGLAWQRYARLLLDGLRHVEPPHTTPPRSPHPAS